MSLKGKNTNVPFTLQVIGVTHNIPVFQLLADVHMGTSDTSAHLSIPWVFYGKLNCLCKVV